LRDYLGYSSGSAARLSSIFPGVGAVSVLATGWLSDRLGVNGRALIMFVGLSATAAALLVLMTMKSSLTGSLLPLIAIGTIAFCLLGPYSYLGGAFALDFGGKQAGAVSSGIIDGVGYLGAVVSGYVIGWVSVTFGWKGVFVALAAVSALAALVPAISIRWARRQPPARCAMNEEAAAVRRLWSQPDILNIEWSDGTSSGISRVCGCATIYARTAIPIAATPHRHRGFTRKSADFEPPWRATAP